MSCFEILSVHKFKTVENQRSKAKCALKVLNTHCYSVFAACDVTKTGRQCALESIDQEAANLVLANQLTGQLYIDQPTMNFFL